MCASISLLFHPRLFRRQALMEFCSHSPPPEDPPLRRVKDPWVDKNPALNPPPRPRPSPSSSSSPPPEDPPLRVNEPVVERKASPPPLNPPPRPSMLLSPKSSSS